MMSPHTRDVFHGITTNPLSIDRQNLILLPDMGKIIPEMGNIHE